MACASTQGDKMDSEVSFGLIAAIGGFAVSAAIPGPNFVVVAGAALGCERRTHLAGALGAALLTRFMSLGWVERYSDSRAVRVTSQGEREFERLLTL